ncbi:unnamed protein product [Angiostrongylus costaricensis]|uniref:HTH psq-type domain-containing protein n=1 Tax=Angiostrongylus costaricensis TaxID=334426 RepID=A0A0R3PAV1_ANGCS|nr:unnamed protein product [Angiostrongylus costaricensis]
MPTRLKHPFSLKLKKKFEVQIHVDGQRLKRDMSKSKLRQSVENRVRRTRDSSSRCNRWTKAEVIEAVKHTAERPSSG